LKKKKRSKWQMFIGGLFKALWIIAMLLLVGRVDTLANWPIKTSSSYPSKIKNKQKEIALENLYKRGLRIKTSGESLDKRITGMVKDSLTNQPLVGVTVKVKGVDIGTVTDANGRFTLEVPDKAVLEISYLGYEPKDISINGRKNVEILLSSTSTGLNQVVVIG